MASKFLQSNRTGWLMAGPAAFLMAMFVILPFLFAIGLSFTNQRLISPNPTEFTGLSNYRQLLGMSTITLNPVRDDAGAIKLDAAGQPEYPAIRSFTRNNPDYPQLEGMREIVPFETIAIPLLLASKLPWIGLDGFTTGWLNSYHVQIIPFVADGLTIYLFVQYFKDFPGELIEAARVEGATWSQIYRRIVMPLAGPVLATAPS